MSDRAAKSSDLPTASTQLLGAIRQMIEETRAAVASSANAGLTALYWRIGKRTNAGILKGKRVDYGEEIVSTVSRQLSWSHFSAS